MRTLIVVATLAAITVMVASAVPAGGAVWLFSGDHRPGDVAESTTAVAWGHSAELGTPEDGPYLIYLAQGSALSETWPGVPDEAMLVGIVEVHLGPYRGDDGDLYGPHHAVARFEIPAVAAGDYQIFHCNDPCTKTLGDVIGGWDLRIVSGPGGRPADEIAAEVRARVRTAPLFFPAASTAPARPMVALQLDDAQAGEQSGEFRRLWIVIVAIIGGFLVVGLVRSDPWRRQRISLGPMTGNQSLPRDVSMDE